MATTDDWGTAPGGQRASDVERLHQLGYAPLGPAFETERKLLAAWLRERALD